MESKVCRRCNQEWPLDHYCKARSNRDGTSYFCRACRTKEDKKYKHETGRQKPFVPTVVDGYKVCTKCKVRKPVADFDKQYKKNCLSSHCRECKREFARNYQIAKGIISGKRRGPKKEKVKKEKPIVVKLGKMCIYPKPDRKASKAKWERERKKNDPVYRARARQARYNNNMNRRGAQGSHTEFEWLAVLAKHGGKCIACGDAGNITRDHIIPIAKGGTNFIENIKPMCLACNVAKSDSMSKGFLEGK